MARTNRKSKNKLRRHLREHKRTYLSAALVVASLVIVFWLANFLVKEEDRYKQVVKGMSGTPEQRYMDALELAAEGDLKQARVVMFRLARLGESADRPLGHGKAHLWVAEDKLTHFNSDFIWEFPGLDDDQGNKMRLPKDEKIMTAQKHLEHAVALNPELEQAITLLAGTLVAQGERNRAVEVLMNAVTHPESPHPNLHVPLANLIAMEGDEGDDLELRESAWHMFETLGKRVRFRGTDIADRISYTINAIILAKYENADITIRMLEARLPAARAMDQGLMDPEKKLLIKRVKALRMAYHYHRAIAYFAEIRSGSAAEYAKVIDELEQVVSISPNCEPAIAALSYIAGKNTSQTARVKEILEGVLAAEKTQDSDAKSQVNMSLAKLAPATEGGSRKFLEDAVASNPENGEAVLQLVKLLLAEKVPDYERTEKLVEQSLKTCAPKYKAELYYRLGEVQLHKKSWNNAIISLEKSLRGVAEKQRVHGLLAEAYTAVGQTGLAEGHRKLAGTLE